MLWAIGKIDLLERFGAAPARQPSPPASPGPTTVVQAARPGLSPQNSQFCQEKERLENITGVVYLLSKVLLHCPAPHQA